MHRHLTSSSASSLRPQGSVYGTDVFAASSSSSSEPETITIALPDPPLVDHYTAPASPTPSKGVAKKRAREDEQQQQRRPVQGNKGPRKALKGVSVKKTFCPPPPRPVELVVPSEDALDRVKGLVVTGDWRLVTLGPELDTLTTVLATILESVGRSKTPEVDVD
jgi:hypothetical protein